jgi:GNAT superfamily N-acetyltransferase
MDSIQVEVRRVRSGEGEVLRDLRLRSVEDAPEVFGQTLDEALQRSPSEWQRLASEASLGHSRAAFTAWIDAQAVGLVVARRRPPDTLALFRMWVDSGRRRRGIGRALIDEAEAWARAWGATSSILWVSPLNLPAIAFYRRLGFVAETVGPDAEAVRDFVVMRHRLDPAPGDEPGRPTRRPRRSARYL